MHGELKLPSPAQPPCRLPRRLALGLPRKGCTDDRSWRHASLQAPNPEFLADSDQVFLAGAALGHGWGYRSPEPSLIPSRQRLSHT